MKNKEAVEAVKEIRAMMQKSSRFTAFSGTSTILIGIFALVGAYIARVILTSVKHIPDEYAMPEWTAVSPGLIVTALAVLLLSLVTITTFSALKAKRSNYGLFNKQTYRTALNFFLPLTAGGVFCIALLINGNVGLIAPAMLLFYGLSLINVAKYTYDNLFWLGCTEVVLGLICTFLPGKGLLFWTIGFGVVHIIYGIYFYFQVERKAKAC